MDPKEERLKGLALFKAADKNAIRHLASAADEVTVAAGHTIISEGHSRNEMFVIESGGADVLIDGKKVAEVPAGEVVGELGYFVRAPASATVITNSESTVLVIPYNRFGQILDENPAMVRGIVTELAERLYATDAKIHGTG